MHSTIAETIPELLVEARQEVQAEMEQAAMTEASAAMQQLVEQGQIDPTEAEMQLQSKATKETAGPTTSEVKEPQSAVVVEVKPREEDMESTPSHFDPERWTQGRVASPKTIKEQKGLAQKGVYLVVATPIGVGTPDIFMTSLADPPLTLQEQKDIRKRGGQVLYSLRTHMTFPTWKSTHPCFL